MTYTENKHKVNPGTKVYLVKLSKQIELFKILMKHQDGLEKKSLKIVNQIRNEISKNMIAHYPSLCN